MYTHSKFQELDFSIRRQWSNFQNYKYWWELCWIQTEKNTWAFWICWNLMIAPAVSWVTALFLAAQSDAVSQLWTSPPNRKYLILYLLAPTRKNKQCWDSEKMPEIFLKDHLVIMTRLMFLVNFFFIPRMKIPLRYNLKIPLSYN